MVIGSQNEPSESQENIINLTSSLQRDGIASFLHHAHFNTINNLDFLNNREPLKIVNLLSFFPFYKFCILNFVKLSQVAKKTMQCHYSP